LHEARQWPGWAVTPSPGRVGDPLAQARREAGHGEQVDEPPAVLGQPAVPHRPEAEPQVQPGPRRPRA